MKMHRILAVILLVPGILGFKFAFVFLMMGSAGSSAKNFIPMYIGYFLYLLSAALGIWRGKFLFGCLIGILLFALGMHMDSVFWQNHNQNLCQQLRNDPYCQETATGFECISPFPSGDKVFGDKLNNSSTFTSSFICKDRIPEEELEKINSQKRAYRLEESKKLGIPPSATNIPGIDNLSMAFDSLESTAKTIISSPNPEKLDFERELSSVNRCLWKEYENPEKAQRIATNILNKLIKTDEERMRYMTYSAAHGRDKTSTSPFSADLPDISPDLGCKTIGKNITKSSQTPVNIK